MMFKFKILVKILVTVLLLLSSGANAVLMDEGKPKRRLGDLSDLIEQKSLRIIVAYDQVGFFINKGKPDGLYVAMFSKFKDFLTKKFPEAKNVKLYFIPVRQDEVVRYIAEGYGDIATGMQSTDELKRFVDFTIPEKLWVEEVAVIGHNQKEINDLTDFSGRVIMVRKSSSYADSLKKLNTYLKAMNLKPVKVVYADEYMTDADLVDMVDKGEIKATITNDSKIIVWKRLFQNVKFVTGTPIKVNSSLVWGIRHDSPELYRQINLFLRDYRDGTKNGTVIYDRYMRTSPIYESQYAKRKEWLGITAEDLEKYMIIFKKYGDIYNLDWKLLMAQAYQESTLNHNARSNRGAVGIMQVLPSTANEWYINVESVSELDNNVHAGTKYMRYMIDNFFSDKDIDNNNRLLFALASYNSGPSRITRYRKKAAEEGLDANIWFNNVEKIARQYGADETVKYVKNISQFYISYSKTYEILKSKKGISDRQAEKLKKKMTVETNKEKYPEMKSDAGMMQETL
ncbi:MAG: lytic transglycosylase F [Ruminobacter sp.]|nr:lytic transglycosylase F [Ruminobacter sp.]